MAQAIMNAKARVISCRNIRKLRKYEILYETEKRKRRLFEDLIQKRFGDSMDQPEKPIPTEYDQYSDDNESSSVDLPEANYPVNTDGTTCYEKPSLIVGYMLK